MLIAICQLNQEADIWTISKATQLLSILIYTTYSDSDISKITMVQLLESIYSVADSDEIIPPSNFISGLNINGLYAYRYHCKVAHISTRTRRKYLRLLLRNRWSKKLLDYPVQGCVARSLNQSTENKIITKL